LESLDFAVKEKRDMRIAIMLLSLCVSASGQELMGIARISDPPPPVDGSLERVDAVASAMAWGNQAQVTVGPKHWQGPADLSGRVFLGWDQHLLYVAAKVRDDTVVQPYFGTYLWKGDHLALFLDVPRQPLGMRAKTKVYQIGISPGNGKTGTEEVGAEVVQWTPTAGAVKDARVASRHTPDGYQVEAAIPWKSLGIDGVAGEGLALGIEIGLSDSDTIGEGGQETVMSLLTKPWSLRDPNRMIEAALGDTSGKVDPSKIKSLFVPVAGGVRVLSGTRERIDLGDADLMPIKELIVRVRLDYRKLAGASGSLKVMVNDVEMTHEHVRNRLKTFHLGAKEWSSLRRTGWFVLYAPNYEMPGAFSPYVVRGINPFELRFDVSRIWEPGGDNVVEVIHTQPIVPRDLVVDVGVSETLSTKLMPPPRKAAPTGPLPTIAPRGPAKPGFTWRQTDGGAIEVKLGARTWLVRSQFSTREPGWAEVGDAGEFVVKRRIEAHDDRLHVTDRITNQTDENLPVMVRHTAELGEGVKHVFPITISVYINIDKISIIQNC